MNNKTITGIIAAVGLVAGAVLLPVTRYVSTTGNDQNTGAADSPYRTIAHCIAVSGANDVCSVAAGDYGSTRVSVNKNITLICPEGACITKGIDVTANGARIENMTAKNGLQRGLSVTANNVEIINIRINGVLCDPNITCELDYFRAHGDSVNFHGGSMTGLTECTPPAHCDGGQNFGSRNAWTNSEFEGVYMEIICGYWQGTSFLKCQGFQIEGDPSSSARTPHHLNIHNNHIVSTRTINIGDSDDVGTTNNISIHHNVIEGRIPRPAGSGLQYGCFVSKGSQITYSNNYIHNIDGSWNNGCSASNNYLWNDSNRTFSPSLSGTNVKRQLSQADLCGLNIGLPCTVVPTNTVISSRTPTPTPSLTKIPTLQTPSKTLTPTNLPPSPTETPTASPVATATFTPSAIPTDTPQPITVNGTPVICPCEIVIP